MKKKHENITERPKFRLHFQLLRKIRHHKFVNWLDFGLSLHSHPYSINGVMKPLQMGEKDLFTQMLCKIAMDLIIRRSSGCCLCFLTDKNFVVLETPKYFN